MFWGYQLSRRAARHWSQIDFPEGNLPGSHQHRHLCLCWACCDFCVCAPQKGVNNNPLHIPGVPFPSQPTLPFSSPQPRGGTNHSFDFKALFLFFLFPFPPSLFLLVSLHPAAKFPSLEIHICPHLGVLCGSSHPATSVWLRAGTAVLQLPKSPGIPGLWKSDSHSSPGCHKTARGLLPPKGPCRTSSSRGALIPIGICLQFSGRDGVLWLWFPPAGVGRNGKGCFWDLSVFSWWLQGNLGRFFFFPLSKKIPADH